MTSSTRVLAINCSPAPGGRTATALRSVLAGAEHAGASSTALVELAEFANLDEVVIRMADADAFVFGSPMYRASYAAPFKALLDLTPRGRYGADGAPLTARAVVIAATGGSDHHFLGMQAMRNILVDFFSAHVVSPGLYIAPSGFTPKGQLTHDRAKDAQLQGGALVELARAISVSTALLACTPLV